MTTTARITFRWADRNHIGEPQPICRHDITWTVDDGKTLAMLSDAQPQPQPQSQPLGPFKPQLIELPKPYIHATLLTETRLHWKDVLTLGLLTAVSIAGASLILWGFMGLYQWIGGKPL